MSDKVRTRFAPSPTGYMHVGNLRTALYAYLIAKSKGGDFILRIEDTDQERLIEGATDIIYNTLKETGLIWDEGPDIGGPVGPYIQSERRNIYKEYAQKLVKMGKAYYCFCDKERLEALRVKQEAANIPTRYDGKCTRLSPDEIEEKLALGIPYVIRQKIPKTGTTTFDDAVYGKVSVDNTTLDDQILLKSDGLPTYNFANVIDDHLMGITHVVRGSEYLSSSPKYNLLYEAFGWEVPVYIHCPPVMKDSHAKLSKRNGDASYQDLVAKGYLKEAVLNYIALLGWAPGSEQEVFSLEELTKAFHIEGISKSPAIFDIAKLNWLNGEYIRNMSLEEFYEMAKPYIEKAVKGDFNKKFIASLLQPRCEVLSDIPQQIDFFDELPDYDTQLYVHKKMKTNLENSKESLTAILPVLEGICDWTMENLHEKLFALIEKLGVKNGLILWPMRVAVSGKQFTPGGGIEIAYVLGKEETIRRVKMGIEKL
jgi:glutamyl-tRNA synthetase